MDGFAEGVIDLFSQYATTVEGVSQVVKRSLNSLDVHGTLGVCLDQWQPIDYEMIGLGVMEPSTAQYTFSVQHVVKWGTQEDGEKLHREVAKAVRLMLYRNPELQVSLRSLVVDEDDRRERFQKLRVTDQRYASNEMKGTFVFLSVTELVIETETV